MIETTKIEVLLVDSDRASSVRMGHFLEACDFRVTVSGSVAEAMQMLRIRHFGIVVSDVNFDGGNGLDLIPVLMNSNRPSLIIFMTEHGSLDSVVKAMGQGAFDYISKSADEGISEKDLKQVMDRALQQLELLNRMGAAHSLKTRSSFRTPSSFIGESPCMVRLYRTIAKTAQSRGHVLIVGESGVGKELVARAIHANSDRASGPFVTVNCSALTETLLESELFGHVKGAFTGASGNKTGLFQIADGGTIFLDEIGDISAGIQVKLLRAVQEGEIKPVGAVDSHRVNVRVFAATHRDLETQIRQGLFREDLYYRLKVFLVVVPALRERKQDIPPLIEYFISRLGVKLSRVEGVSDSALKLLQAYDWPGNIRELENVIERAAGMASTTLLFPEDLPVELRGATEDLALESSSSSAELGSLGEMVVAVERAHIAKVLRSVKYNKSKAAGILQIDRGTLYRKAAEYKIPLVSNA